MRKTRRTSPPSRRLYFPYWLAIVLGLSLGLVQISLAVDEQQHEELQALLSAGQNEQALERIEQSLQENPDEPILRFYQGLVYARQERFDQAIAVLDQLTRDYPDLPEPRNNLAVLYAARGDYDNARLQLTAALDTHPSYATAHENLGDLYSRLAAEAYNKALQQDQGNAGAGAKLAMIDELFSATPASGHRALLATRGAEVETGSAAELSPLNASWEAESSASPDASGDGLPGPTSEAFEAVQGWAEAWSAQRFDDYIASYGSDFTPAGGLTREQWVRQRRTRLASPKFIEVKLDDPEFALLPDGRVRVEFWQSYRSDTYEDSTRKVLILEQEGDDWRIVYERASAW